MLLCHGNNILVGVCWHVSGDLSYFFLVPFPNSNSEQSRALLVMKGTEWGSSLYVTLKLICILHITYGESQPDLPKLQSQSF